ncbi:MAG: hypothetical protein OES59_01715, partial [Gammaproteobacteria bacterium]|nr:hypothetical protein [Gammaproteobacteria bacterium]
LGLYLQGVAILCRAGTAEAANYVTFPAPNTVRKGAFLAALSDILFNKVKHLGRIYRNSRENGACFIMLQNSDSASLTGRKAPWKLWQN